MKFSLHRFNLLGSLFSLWLTGAATAATLPTNFVETAIGGTWNEAVGIAFAPPPENHMFVWERGGRVWIVENNVKLATPFLDIAEEVGGWRDFGLLGFCLDPNFATNGHVYLLYVVDHHHLTKFGTPNYNANTNEYFQATIGRITRYTARASDGFHTVDPASRLVLLGESISNGIPILYESHGVGGLMFGRDGTLLASTGDGASYSTVDTGSAAETYYASALTQGIIKPKENVGAFRSQLVDSLNGKILRIDPATGNGLPSNPFYDAANPRSARSRTWALGLRNPCRMTLRPGTGSTNAADANPGVIYSGDVGMNLWEDLNVCTGPGQNFGWPVFEGLEPHANYSVANTSNQDAPNPLYGSGGCTKQYFYFRDLIIQDTLNAPSWPNSCNTGQQIPASLFRFVHRRPALDWKHGSGPARTGVYVGNNAAVTNVGAVGSPVSGPQFVGNCSIGGVWYTGTDFPPSYQNTYFQADYGAQWIKSFSFDGNDKPTAVQNFLDGGGGIVFVTSDPVSGYLYYISWASVLKRITYLPSTNQPPLVVAAADKTYGPGPLTVQFSSTGSTDPDGYPLSFVWDFGDGSPANNSPNPQHTFNAPPGVPMLYNVKLVATDPQGASATNWLAIAVNNTPPTVTITSPLAGCKYPMTGPSLYNLSATINDAESPAGACSCRWQVYLHHNEHEHAEPPDFNCETTAVISPIGCDEATYYYRITLTVTDPGGLSATNEVRLYPDCPQQSPDALGLAAEYYDNMDLTGLKLRRFDPTVNFNWGNFSPDAVIGEQTFSARWTGKLLPPTTETFTFYTTSDDGIRLWIDNNLIIDSWIDQSPTEHSASVALQAGVKSDIKIEYFENGGGAVAQLAWSSPSVPKASIPASALFPPQTPAALQQDPGADALVVAEAEDYLLNLAQGGATWTSVSPSGAVDGVAMQALPNSGTTVNAGYATNSPRLDFLVNFVRTGTHYIWVRGQGSGTGDRTLHAGLDGVATASADRMNGFSSSWAWSKGTLDGTPATVLVTNTGLHIVNLWMREDGFIADRLLLTTNGNYTPSGNGPAGSLWLSNAPPIVSPIADQVVAEDSLCGPLTFSLASPRVAFNELTLTGASSNPSLVAASNIFFGGCGANRTITVVPTPNHSGSTTISITVGDGVTNALTSFLLTVNPANDAPVATNDTLTVAEDGVLTLAAPGVLANDQDPDGDVLRALLVTGPTHGLLTLNTNGGLVYAPFTNFNGADSFTYRAADATSTSSVATVSLTISPVNDAPIAVADAFAATEDLLLAIPVGGVLTNDGDVEGNSLSAVLVTGPAHGVVILNTNGSFTYLPATNFNGTDSFTYRNFDGALYSEPAAVTLNVSPVNDPPALGQVPNQTTPAGVTRSGVAVAVDDVETPAVELTLAAHSSNPALIPDTNIVITGTGAVRELALTPLGTETGNAVIQLVVTDTNAASATNEFTLTVEPAANLSITAHATLLPAVAGYPLHLTLALTNAGPHPATNITLTGLLPAELISLAAEPGIASYTNFGGVFSAQYAELAVGDGRLFKLHLKPALGGDYTNWFNLTAATADPVMENNTNALWIHVLADADGDGMADEWEIAHGLSPANALDGGLDTDGDGLSNRDEFIAGTDPNSPASVFRVESFSLERELLFLSATGRVYTLYFNDPATSNSWLTVPWQSRVPGLGAPQSLRDTNPYSPFRLYRLGVEWP